jgi:hypothetical protein
MTADSHASHIKGDAHAFEAKVPKTTDPHLSLNHLVDIADESMAQYRCRAETECTEFGLSFWEGLIY